MKILVVDDEKLALSSVARAVDGAFENVQILECLTCKQAIDVAEEIAQKCECIKYAFLDIEMQQMSGLELARILREMFPGIRILFVTAHDQYALEAYRIHARGYLLKPVSSEMIRETLDAMDEGWKEKVVDNVKKPIRIHTFGNFDVYAGDVPITFERSKAKELLAYLVDRAGAGVTTTEIGAVLWEDKEYDRNLKNQTQKVISALVAALRSVHAEHILVKKWNYLALDPEQVECDYYDFLKGDLAAVNSYMGEYMSNYGWAEFTTASLYEKSKRI